MRSSWVPLIPLAGACFFPGGVSARPSLNASPQIALSSDRGVESTGYSTIVTNSDGVICKTSTRLLDEGLYLYALI